MAGKLHRIEMAITGADYPPTPTTRYLGPTSYCQSYLGVHNWYQSYCQSYLLDIERWNNWNQSYCMLEIERWNVVVNDPDQPVQPSPDDIPELIESDSDTDDACCSDLSPTESATGHWP